MEDSETNINYHIYIDVCGIKPENLINYNIEYQSNKFRIIDIIRNTIKYDNEIFDFKIINGSITLPFKIKLHKNYINEILIELKEDNSRKFNIDLRLEKESSTIPYLIIENNQKNYYECKTYFNDLNISRIMLLNFSLDFKIYLEDKKNVIISNLQKEKNEKIKKEKEEKKDKKLKEKKEKIDNDFSLLGRKLKRVKKVSKKYENEVEFSIDNISSIQSNDLLFCIHFFDLNYMTITISEMDNRIKKNNHNIITNEQLQKLYLEIKEKISLLLKDLKGMKLNEFKESLITKLKDYSYNDDIFSNNIKSENDEYLLYMEYFYKFIICNIRNTIKEIINKLLSLFGNIIETDNRIIIIKKVIEYILSKFDQFNSYVNYINDKNNNQFKQYIIINKDNLSIREKLKVYSILLTIIFSSPIYYNDTKIEFFDIDYNNNNVYLMAQKLLCKIIDKLQANSSYLKGLKQTFSKIKKDLNELNYTDDKENREVFIIEMISLEELKTKIKSFLPKRIIRFVNSRSFTNAFYDLISQDIIVNEIIYTNRGDEYYYKNNDNNIFNSLEPFIKGNINLEDEKNKYYYNLYIFRAFWRINHESLGHKAVAKINNNKKETPNKFIFKGAFKKINDAGNILESFVTDNSDKFNLLKYQKFNAQILLNENLFIGATFSNFWNEYKKLEKFDNEQKAKDENTYLYDYISQIFDENIELKVEKFESQESSNIHKEKCRIFFKKCK